jgi:hypothetical protein
MSSPPSAPVREATGHGPAFWWGLALGSGVMAFGLITLLSRAAATRPLDVGAFLIALALGHDLLLAPATIVIAAGLRRAFPHGGRGILSGALFVTAVVVAFSIPLVTGWGAQPDNPSFLPRNYASGVAIVLGAVWGVAAALWILRDRKRAA